jgi:hypothetical protein
MGVVERFLDRIYGMNRKKVAAIETRRGNLKPETENWKSSSSGSAGLLGEPCLRNIVPVNSRGMFQRTKDLS